MTHYQSILQSTGLIGNERQEKNAAVCLSSSWKSYVTLVGYKLYLVTRERRLFCRCLITRWGPLEKVKTKGKLGENNHKK